MPKLGQSIFHALISPDSQGNNILPIGTILPYTGDLNKIPHGWALCDGSNGTPDLQGIFLEGTTDIPGVFVEAGLPNIIGTAYGTDDGMFNTFNGPFYIKSQNNNWNWDNQTGPWPHGISVGFDASKCNSIYGNSNTVQPASYTVYYIIRII